MIIAEQLRTTNRAEYLLYLWQVESIVRAYGADFDKLRDGYLQRFAAEGEQRVALEEWYRNLCRMMHEEGKLEAGHLQVFETVFLSLDDLHRHLLNAPQYQDYTQAYYKALPFIVELRAKDPDKSKSELRTCFELLYGLMLLRLQQKEVSTDTQMAAQDISQMLALLSKYYFRDKAGELKWE